MILFPNCKINLGLNITARRADGYHDLETVFYPLPFYDIVEIIEAPGSPGADTADHFILSGLQVDTPTGENLCERALRMLRKDFPSIPPTLLHLHKAIPPGAGLGGGSADAAFTLRLLNNKFNLGIGDEKMLDYAARLGSDCPFFILNRPCLATGRGEKLKPISLSLEGFYILLVNPGLHISTAEAFSAITPMALSKPVEDIVMQPIETWKEELRNDFEPSVFGRHPLLAGIRDQLYDSGALYASMTGTGSTVYGIFREEPGNRKFTFESEMLLVNLKI